MEAKVTIFDEVNCKFIGIKPEHNEYFVKKYSLLVENAKYNPKVKLGIWDGTIQFFKRNGETSNYLMPEIAVNLKKLGYKLQVDDKRAGKFYDVTDDIDEHYFSHITNPKTKEPYKLTDHQIEAANKMIASGSGIALAGTGFGKAQPLHCKVLTPDGWRTMGELNVGDYVVTPTNRYAKINGIFDQGITDVYKITMEDGGYTFAHPDHIWKMYLQKWKSKEEFQTFSNVSTSEMKSYIGKQNVYLPHIPTALDFSEYDWEVHPYVLGALLPFCIVDGPDRLIIKSYVPSNEMQHFSFLLPREVEYIFNSFGFNVTYEPEITILNPTEKSQLLYDILIRMINNCEFDSGYLFTTAKDRLQFIRGMCDVGGVIDPMGTTNVAIANYWIYDQLEQMIQMQGGFISELNRKRKTDRRYVIVSFSHHIPEIWFTRKNAVEFFETNKTEHNLSRRRTKRRVRSVILDGRMQTRCISIDDPDHLYITDDCIITHNTILNAVLVDKYNKKGCKTLTIVPAKTLIKQTIDQFIALGLDVSHFNTANPSIDHDHLVSTWQTLRNYPALIGEFQMVVVDECLNENTQILTPSGVKSIKDMIEGDTVLSYNVDSNIFEEDVVVKVHQNLAISSDEKMYRLEFDQASIEITGNHKVLTDSGYKRADELTDGDEIIQF
jgi:hypothetical protein